MTKTEIETQVALGTYLPEMWKQRCKLHAEGSKLHAESRKLHAEGSKLHAEGNKLYAEGSKLHAEGSKLHAEGDLLFINAVIEVYGKKIILEWTTTGCKLDNGMEFRYD